MNLLSLLMLAGTLLVPVLASDGNCEASSLLQKAQGAGGVLDLSQTVTFNSPEFQKLLPKIDDKMKPIETAKVDGEQCLRMVQALSMPTIKMKQKALIHTGVLIPDGEDTVPGWADIARKMRLLPLSFLASQNLENTKLIFWANVETTNPLIQEIFEPILEKYSKNIEVKHFSVTAEFAKLAERYAPDNTSALTAELVHIFEDQHIMSSKSNLMRYALLYNYGGAWMDTDVLLVQDLAPILEEDWVVSMYGNFVNQGTLSVSRPASPFITAWMRNILEMGLNTKWAAYGPSMITRMTREVQAYLREKNFHVLPNCFFEGALNRNASLSDQRTTGWDIFFKQVKAKTVTPRLNYIDPTRSRVFHSTFGYHWHNRWDKPIEHGSLAEAAEKMYCQLLDIKLK